MPPPQRQKILGHIAFVGGLTIHSHGTRADIVEAEDAGQIYWSHGLAIVPRAPGPGLGGIEVVQQNRGGTVLLVLANEQMAYIRE